MPSPLSEHTVVILLRRFYATSRCQASIAPRHPQPGISSRAISTIRSCPRPRHRRARGLEPQQRFLHKKRASVLPSDRLPIQLDNGNQGPLIPSVHAGTLSKKPNVDKTQQSQDGGEGMRIAILGGGITGLSAAHYATRELPKAKVTIYESSDKVGGWLRSEYVNVKNGSILLEKGPRTLRHSTPAGLVTLDMIEDLGLQDEILMTSKDSDAARNRFVYYPDHLVKMPGPGQSIYDMLWSMLTEPVFAGLLKGALLEHRQEPRSPGVQDESVGSFLNRRLGTYNVGDNVVSAVLHGIYAGDINKLSVKSLMPTLWAMDTKTSLTKGSFWAAIFRAPMTTYQSLLISHELRAKLRDGAPDSLLTKLEGASVYSFKKGMGALADALEKSLQNNSNVQFKLGENVTSLTYDANSTSIKVCVKNPRNQPESPYTHAISTVSGKALNTLTSNAIPSLALTHSVTVMVVNLYFSDPNILPERGFGYLIPRSVPFDQNPECALGVVFDSDAMRGQDRHPSPGTKVTVMMGGHWWDGYDTYPDEEEGAVMAKSVLARHLKVDVSPDYISVALQKECIPQYTVGHDARVREAHEDLKQKFKGKLLVAGNSYTGVGLNDCVKAARDAVKDIAIGGEDATGLRSYVTTEYGHIKVISDVPHRNVELTKEQL